MSRTTSNLLWGIVLVAAGLYWLLENLNIVPMPQGWAWGIAFAVVGLLFLGVWLRDRAQVFNLIPGILFLALGIMVLGDYVWPQSTGNWGGPFFLGSIGLSFLLIYLQRRDLWWAVIPAGTFFTLALLVLLSPLTPGAGPAVILFLGLALTFAVVYFLPAQTPMRWAIYPAAVFAILGILLGIGLGGLINYVQALVLIALGGFLFYRALRRPPGKT